MSILDRFALTTKVAIVTGGAGLYGIPFTRALAEAGATVVLTSRSSDKATRAAAELRDQGLDVVGRTLDLASEPSVITFTHSVTSEFGHVDILVNNAVHRQGRGITQTTAADWDATSVVNSRGLFLLTQRVAATMVQQAGGSIINIGSIYGIVAPDFSVYEGTNITMPAFYAYDKAGMIGLTRYLAAALGPSGVRVNCLCPGGMQDDDAPPNEFAQRYAARTPLRRMAHGDDPAGALVFLASEASAYVTGAILPVDGGWSVK